MFVAAAFERKLLKGKKIDLPTQTNLRTERAIEFIFIIKNSLYIHIIDKVVSACILVSPSGTTS